MSKQYCTKTDIENYLLLDIKAGFNDQVNRWIEAVSDFVRLETNRDWLADEEASNRVYDGTGRPEVKIDDFIGTPVLEIGENYAENFVARTDFITSPYNTIHKNTLILKDDVIPRGIQNIRVGAKWGYGEEVPQDIRHATTILASGVILAQTNQQGEVASEKIGNYQVTYKNDQHKDDYKQAMDILQKRRVMIL